MHDLLKLNSFYLVISLLFLLTINSCKKDSITTGWDFYELNNNPKKIEDVTKRFHLCGNTTSIEIVSFYGDGRINKDTFYMVSEPDSFLLEADTFVKKIGEYFYDNEYRIDHVKYKDDKAIEWQTNYEYPSLNKVVQKTNWDFSNYEWTSIVEQFWNNKRIEKELHFSTANDQLTLQGYVYGENRNIYEKTIEHTSETSESKSPNKAWYYRYIEFDVYGNWIQRHVYELRPRDNYNKNDIGLDTIKSVQTRKITY